MQVWPVQTKGGGGSRSLCGYTRDSHGPEGPLINYREVVWWWGWGRLQNGREGKSSFTHTKKKRGVTYSYAGDQYIGLRERSLNTGSSWGGGRLLNKRGGGQVKFYPCRKIQWGGGGVTYSYTRDLHRPLISPVQTLQVIYSWFTCDWTFELLPIACNIRFNMLNILLAILWLLSQFSSDIQMVFTLILGIS